MQQSEITIKLRIVGLDAESLRAVAESLVAFEGHHAIVGNAILAGLGSTAEAKRERRNAAIVELRETNYPGKSASEASDAIARDLRRFAAVEWKRVQGSPEAPVSMRETRQALLLRIMQAGIEPIGDRQIRNILAATERKSSALAISQTSLVSSTVDVHET